MQNIYLIKNPTQWMFDELRAFSNFTPYKIIFFRTPSVLYTKEIHDLEDRGVEVYINPYKKFINYKELCFAIQFIFRYLKCFKGVKNFIFGLKALIWFLRLNKKIFQLPCNIHAQFATQTSIIACILKDYFSKDLSYSFTYHAYDVFYKNQWFNLIYSKADTVFSISNYNLKYITTKYNISPEKLKLSRLGVYKPTLQKKSNDAKIIIGFLSRITEKKGLNYLINATVHLLKKANKPFELIIAGDGPQKLKYEDLSRDLKVDNLISFIGSVSGQQKNSFFNKIDIFCLPSISIKNDMDGLPVVLMEAISYNIPIVSTRLSGIPEICIDGFNGFLINEKDSLEIAAKLEILINEPEVLKRLSSNCSQTFKNYDILMNSKKKLNTLKWI